MCRYLVAVQQQQQQQQLQRQLEESASPIQYTTTRRFTYPNIEKRFESEFSLTPDTIKRVDNANEGGSLFAGKSNTIAARSLRSAGSSEMMGLLAAGGEAFGGPDGVWNDEMGMSRWQPMRGKRQQQQE